MPKVIQLPLGPLQTNCYIFLCEVTNQAAVIDPAWDGAGIFEQLQTIHATLTHILLTHTHFDHVAGLAELKTLTNAPIYIHPDAIPMLEQSPLAATRWGFTIDAPPSIDYELTTGDKIYIGKETMEVLFTPGHAPGHVSFYLPAHHLLFDGDVLFQGSIGRTDLPGGNMAELMRSIKQELLSLPDDTQVLSGHGAVTTIGQERLTNPFLQ